MADPNADLMNRWGVGGDLGQTDQSTNTPFQRSVDDKGFAAKWLADIPHPDQPVEDPNSWRSTIRTAMGNMIDSVPIVGPYVRGGIDRLRAATNSAANGTSYQDELAFRQKAFEQGTVAHPTTALASQLTGAVAPFVVAGGIPVAARALGMAGSLGARTVIGAGSNALIGGADTAVRTGGDLPSITRGAAIGGTLGGAAPIVGRAVAAGANAALRPAADAVTQRLLGVAQRYGIPIGAAQTSTSPFAQKVSQIAGQFPGSGQNAFQANQVSRFTRAVSSTFGEDAENLTPQVMQTARRRIGGEFDTVAQNTNIHADPTLATDLLTVAHEVPHVLTEQEVRPIHNQINNIITKIQDGNGTIPGETYQALTRKGTPLDLAMHSPNPNIAHYAGQIREALDDALQRSATPEMSQRLSEARRQYKNLMTVAPLVVKGVPGEVSPLALQSRVNTSFKGRAFSGGGDLGDLADLGQRFFRRPPDSGTPMGMVVADQMMKHGNALGAATLGAITGGGYLAGYEPADILKGVGGMAAAGLLARGATSVLNRPQTLNALISRAPYISPSVTNAAVNQLANRPGQQPQ